MGEQPDPVAGGDLDRPAVLISGEHEHPDLIALGSGGAQPGLPYEGDRGLREDVGPWRSLVMPRTSGSSAGRMA